MANRTFGWVQNPASTETLRDILSMFVPGSQFHSYMVKERLPLLASANLFKSENLYLDFQKILRASSPIPYDILKGQGAGEEGRPKAKCSGLAQAAVTGQKYKEYVIDGRKIRMKKPYTDDWSADGFLRWAVSLGFLDYSYSEDTCSITPLGTKFVKAQSEKEKNEILGRAFLSYPPVCRVLGLLKEYGHLTKFEIGANLGFTDEAGFTSFPQNIWVQAYEETSCSEDKKNLRSDVEGSSDKYARMICGWLEAIGWVSKRPKMVTERIGGKTYHCEIPFAFEITGAGIINYRKALGLSKAPRTPKIVYREMLASKAPNANYLRMRRSLILCFLENHVSKSANEIRDYLATQGVVEDLTVIKDDLAGLINIGLDIEYLNGQYKLKDKILKLIPYIHKEAKENIDAVLIKDRARAKLNHIDHKYLTLIDFAFSGKGKSLDFEVYTIDLLVNELSFQGKHLGGSRKPDGIFYYLERGVIIDNKAYSKGFTISRHMADEMIRYVQENNDRNPERNPNQWWLNFGNDVSQFNYVFLSSTFRGEVEYMLDNIKQSTGIDGCVLTAENLLYFADAIKGGIISNSDFLSKFAINRELEYPLN
ncbi:MAG: hypothetical protein LIO79_09820 [Rikenellaceae bacterium]|nr:hypothetical protein [Rikenellaceae bacterium]